MLFNSLHFVFFFILVTGLYFLFPYRFRWTLLLAASCYFYMVFKPVYILILFFTIVIDYYAGIYIEKAEGQKRKNLLIVSLAANIGILAIFKYFNFLNENLSQVLSVFDKPNPVPFLEILLPIGLSFHTFQAMSYTIEVYRGHQKPESHFGIYALYVMFYPQLVAGPIERPQNILHQYHEKFDFDYDRVVSGLRKMAWGMFKKIVVADRLAVYVNKVYDHPDQFSGVPVILATVFFAIQIYCDFSGYSDIAIGSARVMGFTFMQNFNLPYFSRSVSEFWSRWHISLSTWFRDYLYIPLGGNRVARPKWFFNLFFTFLISGLWHGASWNFIIWGALHGTFLVVSILLQPYWKKAFATMGLGEDSLVKSAVEVLGTFSLVSLAWVFFRAPTFEVAAHLLSHMFVGIPDDLKAILFNHNQLRYHVLFAGIDVQVLLISLLVVFILFSVETVMLRRSVQAMINRLPVLGRWSIYSLFIAFFIVFGVFRSGAQFIYFQF